ncbi:DUF5980 family protein [Umezawaea endophytica]|uniref:DUF5980 family protein n=1 Tax=Umezawaea endophytica TaxID=1654476 RepID=A0A9X2VQ57_9PSEU|nr:DUF5980 family protein [Umezawaea endophytica]MCS7480142.1 DUF5980 family protein [Umezawaea endophytica]
MLAVLAALALALLGNAPSAIADGANPTWTLRDIGQRMCVNSGSGHSGTYFFVPVFGTWSTPIKSGIRDLPAGSTGEDGTPLPPGSNHGNTIIAFVLVSIAPTPVGVYTPEVWASDGVVTQAVPVTIHVQDRC